MAELRHMSVLQVEGCYSPADVVWWPKVAIVMAVGVGPVVADALARAAAKSRSRLQLPVPLRSGGKAG